MSRALAVIPISIQRMICDGCGAETNAACNCGVAYPTKAVRAREAVEAQPREIRPGNRQGDWRQSDHGRQGREELSSGEQSDEVPRTGLDGKTPENAGEEVAGASSNPDPDVVEMEAPKERRERLKKPLPDIEDDEQYTLNDYFDLNKENSELRVRVDKLSAALEAKEVQAGRNWPEGMTKKQKKKRDKHLGGVAYYQRQLEYLYAEVTNAPNWRVIITEDGKREGNGLRFALREEAERDSGRSSKRRPGKSSNGTLPAW